MTDGPTQSALREWRDQFRHPATLVALVSVVAILAMVAPYGTDTALRPLPRFGYWALIVPVTYAAGSLVVFVMLAVLPAWAFLLRMSLAGAAAGLAVAASVLGINAAALGFVPERATLPGFVLNVMGIGFVVTLAIAAIRRHLAPVDEAPRHSAPAAPPAILERLPLEKRGALLALSVEDHYVRVYTSAGTEMVLMRLSDAMKETGAVQGAQVHRSHWVAFNAVQNVQREGDRALLTLRSGAEIPVSRANMPKIKEAGLLPR